MKKGCLLSTNLMEENQNEQEQISNSLSSAMQKEFFSWGSGQTFGVICGTLHPMILSEM